MQTSYVEIWKQVRDQKVWKQVLFCLLSNQLYTIKIGIANSLELIFVL